MVYNVAMPPEYPQQPNNPYVPPENPLPQPTNTPPYPSPPLPPTPKQQPMPQPGAYDFIVKPLKPTTPKRSLPGLPTPNSLLLRLAYAGGGLLILLILFVIAKGIIVGKPKLDSFVSIAQDQQELIHLATNASTSTSGGLSTGNQNVAATVQAVLGSNQIQITKYLSSNHLKTSVKTLGLRINTSLDTQLANAESAGTYNQVFQSTIDSQLVSYTNDLKQAYPEAGTEGKALLSSDYKQAGLLYTEASSPSNLVTN
jgi:hypothetical protein